MKEFRLQLTVTLWFFQDAEPSILSRMKMLIKGNTSEQATLGLLEMDHSRPFN